MNTTTVVELMTTPVLTVEGDEHPGNVADAMLDTGVNSVVIIDADCHPIGIVTATDYVALTAAGVDPYETTLADHMTTDILTGKPDEHVSTVADRMAANDISHLPIVDEDRQVTGIVTQTDLTEYLAAQE